VATPSRDVLPPESPSTLDVQVNWDRQGGWRVDAVRDGHVVASRHCDDWHRVERVRAALAAEHRATAAPAALTAAR
jgi:hypothetical protein